MESQIGRSSNLDAPPIVVPTHNLARWVRSKLEVRSGVMLWEVPRTILGLVPYGKRRVEVPASDVLQISVARAVRPIGVTAGLGVIVASFLLGWGWWAVLTVPLGLWIVLVALGPRMTATTREGRAYHADVCFGHQIDADLYIAAVEDIASQ